MNLTVEELAARIAEPDEKVARIVADAPPPPQAAIDILKATGFPFPRGRQDQRQAS